MNIEYLWYKVCQKTKGVAKRNSRISKDAKIGAGSVFVDSSIDRFSYCGYDCFIVNTEIGAFCSLSDKISIGGGTHPMHWCSTSPAFYKGRDSISKRLASLEYDSKDLKTVIGNDVWIGRGAFIKSGVTIGDGAIIGMGSIVTKDVPAYSVVVGTPAKVIKMRFDEKTIEDFKKIKWWDFDETKLKKLSKYMDNPNLFINEAK